MFTPPPVPPAASVPQAELDAMEDEDKWAWLYRLAQENEAREQRAETERRLGERGDTTQ